MTAPFGNPERATYTLREVAALIGVSYDLVLDAIADGSFPIPVKQIRSRRVVARAAVDRWLASEDEGAA